MEDRPPMFSNEPHLESDKGKMDELFLEPAATGMHEPACRRWVRSGVGAAPSFRSSWNCGIGELHLASPIGMAKHAKTRQAPCLKSAGATARNADKWNPHMCWASRGT